jgi:membrane protease YdiL (CAAX protease family)
MANGTIFIILVVFPFVFAFAGNKAKSKNIKNKNVFYGKEILTSLFLLLLILLLNPRIYKPLDFQIIGKGIYLGDDILSVIEPIFFIPLVFALTSLGKLYPKNIAITKELYGYPVGLLPDNGRQYAVFFFYIIAGVVFEELFCRQFMFYSFHQVLNLKGDILLIITSLLFAAGHLYQGWKGLVSSFAIGMILGKIFQMTGNIFYPIGLHLAGNLTIAVLAFRRIKDLQRINT